VETNNTPKTEEVEVTSDKGNQDSYDIGDTDNNININSENGNANENVEENTDEQVALVNNQPSDRIELLEFLLEFIETEGELNYVLAGYFSKFFITLLNRNSGAVIFLLFIS